MDVYLNKDSSYNRLYEEYNKYGTLIIAVDFDDTLFDFHNKGGDYSQLHQLIRDLYKINCYIIVWTGNENISLIRDFMIENYIPYHSINENHVIFKDKNPRKIYANVYLDDRGGLKQVYKELSKLIKIINNK